MTADLDLATRLKLLEDERAILRTLYRYGHGVDAGEEEAWVDCFTEDGRFFAHGRHTSHTALESPAVRRCARSSPSTLDGPTCSISTD